jgi:2-desacetyl-2-hydroxyethyl bacteriochlorophyllide A dehydrogenase
LLEKNSLGENFMEMKAVVIEKPGEALIKTVPVPPVGDYDVKIKVKASGICGTDVHVFRGTYLGSYPIIPGHEYSGVVEETGPKVTRIKTGDRVAIEPNICCDNCDSCLSNRQNFCRNWKGVGTVLNGGMAEYSVLPEKAVFNTGNLPFLYGSFVEPLSCVLHGVQRARITMADKVLILGAGPIGILLSKVIQLQGASEIVQVDKNAARLELAKKCGAAKTFASLEEPEKDYYDVVVDASGSKILMDRTVAFARKGGTILLFGVPSRDAKLEFPAFTLFEKGLTVLTSYTSVRNSIQAVRLLESGKVDVSSLISHQLPLADFVKGVETVEKGIEGVLKIVILPEESGPAG